MPGQSAVVNSDGFVYLAREAATRERSSQANISVRSKADKPTDPQERHPSLVHQAPQVAPGHPEPLGELVHGQQPG